MALSSLKLTVDKNNRLQSQDGIKALAAELDGVDIQNIKSVRIVADAQNPLIAIFEVYIGTVETIEQ